VHFRTIIGTGANPNVAAVVVIGIEPGWTKRIADGIRATGKPVAEFSIEQNGDFETIRAASWAAKDFVHHATEIQREECSINELWVSTKCGESDTTTGLGSCPTVGNMYDKLLPEGITGFFGETSEITGAEHICQKRAINEEVGERWYKMWKAYQDDVIFAHQTDDLSDSQPTATSRAASRRLRKRRLAISRRSGGPRNTSTFWNRQRLRNPVRGSILWTALRLLRNV